MIGKTPDTMFARNSLDASGTPLTPLTSSTPSTLSTSIPPIALHMGASLFRPGARGSFMESGHSFMRKPHPRSHSNKYNTYNTYNSTSAGTTNTINRYHTSEHSSDARFTSTVGSAAAARRIECSNCGDISHMFRSCPHPVTSIGIIAIRQAPGSSHEILMIQRKDSLGYVELLRGKYEAIDLNYIVNLMGEMTSTELAGILTHTFDDLWDAMWNRHGSRQYKQEYYSSKTKWQTLIDGVVDASGNTVRLSDLVARVTTPGLATNTSGTVGWPTPEWGFPKGRRNARESDIACAMREFQEETGLTLADFTIVEGFTQFTESFVGSNKVLYCHKYFLAKCASDCAVRVDMDNSVQKREVGDIRWVSPDEGDALIRPYDITKKAMLRQVEAVFSALDA